MVLGLILACSKSADGPDTPDPGANEGCRTGRISSASPNGDMTTLIWADEFEVDGAPCSENWFLETVPPNNGSWWNNEEQYYTNRRSNSNRRLMPACTGKRVIRVIRVVRVIRVIWIMRVKG